MVYRCIGCGSFIQSENINKPGYVDPSVLEKKDLNNLYCKRCYDIRHYNKIMVNDMPYIAYLQIIEKITKSNSLFVYVFDLFDLSFDLDVFKRLANKDVILVFNKVDLLPKSLNQGRLKAYLKKMLFKYNIKYKDLILVSTKKKYNIDLLTNTILKWQKGRNAYLLGYTNAGKSSLINQLIKSNNLLDYDVITTSASIATTTNLIEIPFFADGKKLYDSPGIIYNTNFLSKIDVSLFKKYIPQKEIKPLSYQLKQGDSLVVSDCLVIKVLENDTNLVLYLSNLVDVLKTKIINSDKHLNNELKYQNLTFDMKAEKDIFISGLGFIDVKKCPTKLEIKLIDGVEVKLRDAIFG